MRHTSRFGTLTKAHVAVLLVMSVVSTLPRAVRADPPPDAAAPAPAAIPPPPEPPARGEAELAPPEPGQVVPPEALPPPEPGLLSGQPLVEPPRLRRTPRLRSPAMLRAGIVLTTLGVAAVGTGSVVYSVALTSSNSNLDRFALRDVSIGLWAGGAALIATGIPLWLLGGQAVRQRLATYLPAVGISPRAVALSWRF